MLTALVLGGCASGEVTEPLLPSAAPDGTSAPCQALVAALPDQLAGLDRTDSPAEGTALWRDADGTAVTLRCGVPPPEGYDDLATCQDIEGVAWFAPEEQVADQSLDAVLTTVEQTPHVELTVPASLRPPVAALVDVAPAVRDSLGSPGC
ncbi:MAG: DUF3515 domain-containing protein [Nocardioides sp.]|nr:DUF3515 domain-containing protein [Nocardioides sp.]